MDMTEEQWSMIEQYEINNVNVESTSEEIILAFIDFVKVIERCRGLTDTQIIAKYIYEGCGSLADGIRHVLKTIGKEDFTNHSISPYHMVDGMKTSHNSKHHMIALRDVTFEEIKSFQGRVVKLPPKPIAYYDIFGKHDDKSVRDLVTNFFLNDKYFFLRKREIVGEKLNNLLIPSIAADFF